MYMAGGYSEYCTPPMQEGCQPKLPQQVVIRGHISACDQDHGMSGQGYRRMSLNPVAAAARPDEQGRMSLVLLPNIA
jgi:hypothetical protein